MIEDALTGLIQQGVLGILNIILLFTIRFIYLNSEKKVVEREKITDSEKDRMRSDIRRVIDNKEDAFGKERESLQNQIVILQDRLEGNNEQLLDIARKGS